jgi:PPOX class probable F420-dependent enzyme
MRMTTADARQRFQAARVARLATVTGLGAPHLVPVTFAVIGAPLRVDPHGTAAQPSVAAEAAAAGALIVFAIDHKPKSTTALRRLDNIAANPRVTFLADSYAEDWARLWWVRADCTAEIVDGAVRDAAISTLCAKYPQYQAIPPDGVVVGAVVDTWMGWQASAEPEAAADG